jgi:hypothetical protein
VCDGLDFLDGPTQPVRIDEIFRFDLEELSHLLQSIGIVPNVPNPRR